MVVEVRLELSDPYENHLFEVLEVPVEQDNFLYLIEDKANDWFYQKTEKLFSDITAHKGVKDTEDEYERYLESVSFLTDTN